MPAFTSSNSAEKFAPSFRPGKIFAGACVAAVAFLSGCATRTEPPPALYVYSTIDALLSGAYDGELTVKELGTKGDFGLGTYNRLDGEMLLLDGVFYHFRGDGSVQVGEESNKVPLAYVLPFKPTRALPLALGTPSPTTLAAIEAYLDTMLTNKNMFYAVAISGDFSGVTTRAIYAQSRPYKPLAELVKTQSEFQRASVSGTMAGFRSPPFSKGISVPGWHWHFISDDKKYGGHVLKVGAIKGVAKVAETGRFIVDLPTNEDFANADQAKDRSVELHQVEKAR